jgi:hypothetical protein
LAKIIFRYLPKDKKTTSNPQYFVSKTGTIYCAITASESKILNKAIANHFICHEISPASATSQEIETFFPSSPGHDDYSMPRLS